MSDDTKSTERGNPLLWGFAGYIVGVVVGVATVNLFIFIGTLP